MMSLATEQIVNPALTSGKTSARDWILLWVAVLLVEGCLLVDHAALDSWLWLATRWAVGDRAYYSWGSYHAAHAADAVSHFYTQLDPPLHSRFFKHSQHLWEVLRAFGEPWMTTLIVVLLIVYGRKKWLTASIAAGAALAAGGVGALIRIITGRTRPTHIDAANEWVFLRGFHNGADLSFPSGHATVAFATAAVLTYFSPKGRGIFIAAAAGCALSRVVMGAHFYADAIFGAALGWTVGWGMTAWIDQWLTRLDSEKSCSRIESSPVP
jgi:membrane-associated phospholipid phosphatase